MRKRCGLWILPAAEPHKNHRITRILKDLHFNVVYAQMSRGKTEKWFLLECRLQQPLSRLAMDCCLYMNQNFGFISFPDELTTGSSIMPHKKPGCV
jgi:argininosuccinate lyase